MMRPQAASLQAAVQLVTDAGGTSAGFGTLGHMLSTFVDYVCTVDIVKVSVSAVCVVVIMQLR